MTGTSLLRRAAVAGALLAVALTAAASGIESANAQARDRFTVEGWNGNAVFRDGELAYCIVRRTYRSGTTLLFLQTPSYAVTMGMSNRSWNLNPGGGYRIGLVIDGRRMGEFSGRVNPNSRTLATFPLGNRPGLFEALRGGRQLTVFNNGNPFPFQLSGTSAALARLRNCVNVHTGRVEEGPDSISEAPFGRPDPDDQLAAGPFGATAMAEIADRMTQQGYSMVAESDRRENWPGASRVWRQGDGLLGGLISFRTEAGQSAADKYEAYLARLRQVCGGDFEAEIYARESWGDAEAIRAIATCAEGRTQYVMPFVLIGHSEGAVVGLHFGEIAGREGLFQADDRIVEALRARYGS